MRDAACAKRMTKFPEESKMRFLVPTLMALLAMAVPAGRVLKLLREP